MAGGDSKLGRRQKMSRDIPCKGLVMITVELVVDKVGGASKLGRRQKEARANPLEVCKRLVMITVEESGMGCKEDSLGEEDRSRKIGLRQKMSRGIPCKGLVLITVEWVVDMVGGASKLGWR